MILILFDGCLKLFDVVWGTNYFRTNSNELRTAFKVNYDLFDEKQTFMRPTRTPERRDNEIVTEVGLDFSFIAAGKYMAKLFHILFLAALNA